MELSVGSFGSARGAFDQQLGDFHQIVGEHRRSNKQFEVLSDCREKISQRLHTLKTVVMARLGYPLARNYSPPWQKTTSLAASLARGRYVR
jgi:hypothetical protein